MLPVRSAAGLTGTPDGRSESPCECPCACRKRFPLHFIVFKQTASHLPYEANVERVFSLAGYLSDPCRHADHLVDMVMASVNRKACDPSVDAITTMYYEMFRGIAEAGTVNSELDSD